MKRLCDQRRGEGLNPMQNICSREAVFRYPAMGGGYMLLCAVHGEKHRSICERWDGRQWRSDEEPR